MGCSVKNTTIVDIARLANVTNITVSRAFNKPEQVKKETRDKIFSIAKELNYSPNAFARNLKFSSSNIIGVVTDSTYNPVYMEVIKRLCLEADKKGYTVMMFETNGSEHSEARAIDALFSYKASGIVLSPTNDNLDYAPDYIEKAQAFNMPLILLDRDLKKFNLPGVFLNNYELGLKAGQYLRSCEYERMLIFGGPQSSQITQDRINGLIRSLDSHKTQYQIVYADYNYNNARPIVLKALHKLNKKKLPQCIVGINGPISLAAIGSCRMVGIHREVKYFSFDEVPYTKDFGYSIPCIANDPQEWGQEISTLLFKLIENSNSSEFFDRIYIRGKLFVV